MGIYGNPGENYAKIRLGENGFTPAGVNPLNELKVTHWKTPRAKSLYNDTFDVCTLMKIRKYLTAVGKYSGVLSGAITYRLRCTLGEVANKMYDK